ncbi:MAG: response regulator transcription factor [Bacteroidales bacterium]|nr:response regulator transcription factor [Bacteroidales bacterium]
MNKRSVLLIEPSALLARGLESIFNSQGEFEVVMVLPDFSRGSQARLRNLSPDLVIVDPIVFDYGSRANGRALLAECCDCAVVALRSTPLDEEGLRQYDETLGLFDDPVTLIRKLRSALESRQETARAEGDELSAREKEILVCVAKGMLNKEIADRYHISIYTVITHRKNITRKTGIKTVAGLTVYALLNNLIDMNDFE